MARTIMDGPIASRTRETDGEIFIPASKFQFDVGTWTLTRGAAGNYFMRKTAGDDTSHPSINLTDILCKKVGTDPNWSAAYLAEPTTLPGHLAHDIRGVQILTVRPIYAIGTEALDAHTYDLHRTTYANNAAPVVDSTIGGTLTGTLATAVQAQPYLTVLTVGTPYVLGNNIGNIAEWFELTVNAAATSVYDLYGATIRFAYNLL